MARHIELGHHADTPITRVGDNFPNFRLGVIEAAGFLFLKERVPLTFDVESLVIRKAPMEHIEFDCFHAVEIALDYRETNETMTGIDEQTAPGKARSIFDGNNGNGEAL